MTLRFVARTFLIPSLCFAAAAVPSGRSFGQGDAAQASQSESTAVDKTSIDPMTRRAVEYLRLRGQKPDGSFSDSVGVTAVVAAGLTTSGVPADDPVVAKALDYLLKNVQEDGGIHAPGSRYANYETCIAAMAINEINEGGKYDQVLDRAEQFIRKGQWDQDEEVSEEDLRYGGAGYGSKARPDLSNTAFMIEALKELGASEDDPAIQKALVFVTRCQNLESEINSSPFAAKVDDGGFYYTVAAGGASVAGETENGGLRSYPAMTYAGLKSMIYAGLDDSDFRVKAAKDFLRKNYSVEQNPFLGDSGLYYYYQTMSKALAANGEPVFQAEDGPHVWRRELLKQLQERQREDGSWVNSNERFMESDPNLVTGYALLTLATIAGEQHGN